MDYTIEVTKLPVTGRTFNREVTTILLSDGRLPTYSYRITGWDIQETTIGISILDANDEGFTVTLEVTA